MTVVFRLPQTAGEKSVPLPAAIPPKIPASTHVRTVTVQITNPALSWAWPGGHLTRNRPALALYCIYWDALFGV